MADIRFAHVAVNGVKLHVAEAGPRDGRLVLLLHGFPEYWESWRYYIDRLAAAGYHVLVPDQRGYNLSDKPAGLRAYDIDTLAADVGGLAGHFGQRRYTVIGHDWGGLVAWWIATRHPEQLDQLVIMNAPHPSVWREAMRDNPEQRRRSWYVRVFRLPWLPEYLLRRRHFGVLAESISRRARPDTVTPEELDRYRAAWAQPGALTAMLNWYRAFLVKDLPISAQCRIATPALLIWGERDPYGVRQLADDTLSMCDNAQAVSFKDATHWVQHDEPQRCAEALLGFLKRGP